MKLLAALTELFVQAFQITAPVPEQQQKAQIILGSLMLLALFVVAGLIAGMLIWAFHA